MLAEPTTNTTPPAEAGPGAEASQCGYLPLFGLPEDGSFRAGFHTVDTTVADAEIAAFESGSGSAGARDRHDEANLWSSAYPDLSAPAQTQLVAVYQYACHLREELKAERLGGAAARRAAVVVSRSERYCDYMLRAVHRKIRETVRRRAQSRFPETWRDHMEDLLGEATAVVLVAAREYVPTKGATFCTWADQQVTNRLGEHMNSQQRAGHLSSGSAQAVRVLRNLVPELAQRLGRQPSPDECRGGLAAYAWAYTAERLSEEQAALPEAERARLIASKLTKSGWNKAIEDTEALLGLEGGDVSLDAGDGQGLGDRLGSSHSVEQSCLVEVEQAEGEAALGVMAGHLAPGGLRQAVLELWAEGPKATTAKKMAEKHGVAELTVRHAVRDARCRARAPHAQYAHLCSGLARQFDPEAPAEDDSAFAALGRRAR